MPRWYPVQVLFFPLTQVIHRFAGGNSPQICLQCVMIPDIIHTRKRLDAHRLQVEYARRHKYDLYTYVGDGQKLERSLEWYKLLSSQYLIEAGTTGCDYFFWIDEDSVIMNMSFELETLIHWKAGPDTDAVITAEPLTKGQQIQPLLRKNDQKHRETGWMVFVNAK